jgi:hypothetical protein
MTTTLYVNGTVTQYPILRPGDTCPVCGIVGDARWLHVIAGQECCNTENVSNITIAKSE